MGRSKSIPIQQRYDANDNQRHRHHAHEPVLGRRMVHLDVAASVSPLSSQQHANNNVNNQNSNGDCDVSISNSNSMTDDNLDDTEPNIATRLRRKRPPTNDGTTIADTKQRKLNLKPSSYPSTLSSLIQRIEGEQEQQKQRRRKQSAKKKSLDKKNDKTNQNNNNNGKLRERVVTFVNGEDEKDSSEIIPPPEIRIVQVDHNDDGTVPTTPSYDLHYHFYPILGISSETSNTSAVKLEAAAPIDNVTEKNNQMSNSQDFRCYWILLDHDLSPLIQNVHLNKGEGHDIITICSSQRYESITPLIQAEQRLPIVTKQGAIDMWNLITLATGRAPKNQSLILALGRAVQDEMIRFELQISTIVKCNDQNKCNVSNYEVRLLIGLTDLAISLCCPDGPIIAKTTRQLKSTTKSIPSSILRPTRSRHSKKLPAVARKRPSSRSTSLDLFTTLAILFPHSIIADVFLNTKTKQLEQDDTPSTITAKQVYALTDNVQLNNAYKISGNSDIMNSNHTTIQEQELIIPGLLPRLRPYQCKAVQWMLRRERSTQNSNDEWELAWVVLSSRKQNRTNDKFPVGHICSNDDTEECVDQNQYPIFLPTWKQNQKTQNWHSNSCNSDNNDVLLFCPYMGWFTNSIDLAKVWTIGPSTTATTGGILAEAMGLGKTVEVLACILANPRPNQISSVTTTPIVDMKKDGLDSSCSNSNIGARRQLHFSNSSLSNTSTNEQPPNTQLTCKQAILYVDDDINQFGDAESDTDDNSIQSVKTSGGFGTGEKKTTDYSQSISESDQEGNVKEVNIVTPTKEPCDSPTDEVWTEDSIIGACICGNLIGFDCGMSTNCNNIIIICSSCREPMHTKCASFDSYDEMVANTSILYYRQHETNSRLYCRVCDPQYCPCCVKNIESSATLIVTPAAILSQWEREICRHTRLLNADLPLRVVNYDGIKRTAQSNPTQKGCSLIKYMHPRHLANADVVLTTFDALMSDLGHTNDNQFVSRGTDHDFSGALRKRKRYRIVPSPLLSIMWWRVCLDEAQRVETPTAGTAQMALKIDAVHRWCISGTPIQRGNLNDLFGLLLFLRLDPFCDKRWFQKCFSPSHRNMDASIKHLLNSVFWRSTKASELVRSQMGIPEQIEKKFFLTFSSIEKHFYERQLEQSIDIAIDVNNQSAQSSKKKALHFNLLSNKLHKLRAACCHPQVGSSGINGIRRNCQTLIESGFGSQVMTMSQILDKFIDDAKIQCEEAQRLVVLHTNGMAATSRLKVEAKQRGIDISESDTILMENCCCLYNESLRIADENSTPAIVYGEVFLEGSMGFRSHGKTMDNYSFILDWQRFDNKTTQNSVWAKFNVATSSSRKLTQVKARACQRVPMDLLNNVTSDFQWNILLPKDCVFQCMATSGEFETVCSFTLPFPNINEEKWIESSGFRTNKSKAWRIVVENFHTQCIASNENSEDRTCRGTYIGLELQCFEATISSDPLQRLHCLHNASQSYTYLLQLLNNESDSKQLTGSIDIENGLDRVKEMTNEAIKIESIYLDSTRAIHRDCMHRLVEAAAIRKNLESEMHNLTKQVESSNNNNADCWDDLWWDDFLVACLLYGNEAQQRSIYDKIKQDLDGMMNDRFERSNLSSVLFPMFGDIAGLRTALQLRVQSIRSGIGTKVSRRNQQADLLNYSALEGTAFANPVRQSRFCCARNGHTKCIQYLLGFTEYPSSEEIRENSQCHVCKADWFQTGPKCRICEIGDTLVELTPDKVTIQLLNSLYSAIRSSIGSDLLCSASGDSTFIADRAKTFFDLLEVSRKERSVAYRLWRTHLSLLNDIDELNQCKSSMRLAYEGEDILALTKELQNTVIEPIDVNLSYHQYAAKQGMALGALSRAKGTLQYLKNLSAVERQRNHLSIEDDQTCLVCLSKFEEHRAVLRCGHCFHLTPCLEKLRTQSFGTTIKCPLRCTVKTMIEEVMISSERTRQDEVGHGQRQIKGNYGTKVTRLVNDVLDICEMGEKGLVFSQWDDMLDICFHALSANGIQVVRASRARKLGECIRRFRDPDCNIMLLNIKNGAEGLTLVEATHVFMVEPLLNCGLDNQAINRIHRIGQNRKTFVWRYIVEDTVEVKIDRLRMSHQEDQLEDSVVDGKRSLIQAGGIDGGFHSHKELLDLLQP